MHVTLFGNQTVTEDIPAAFNCTAPSGESIVRYIWKRDGLLLSNNLQQYTFVPKRNNNGQILSCAAVTVGGVISQESNFTLQVYCKWTMSLFQPNFPFPYPQKTSEKLRF